MKALLLLALALIACETPQPPDCPGTRVAAFHFSPVNGGTTCSFYADGGPPQSSDFTAVLAWDPGGTQAALCVQRPYASPALGTHTGDQVAVTGAPVEGITPSACESSCTVTVVETINDGQVQRSGPDPTRFTGTLQDTLSGKISGVGSSCGCGLPCEVTYPIDGGVVQ